MQPAAGGRAGWRAVVLHCLAAGWQGQPSNEHEPSSLHRNLLATSLDFCGLLRGQQPPPVRRWWQLMQPAAPAAAAALLLFLLLALRKNKPKERYGGATDDEDNR